MKKLFFPLLTILLLSACGRQPENAEKAQKITIFPDYTDIVIPPNIAALNFKIADSAWGETERCAAYIFSASSDTLRVYGTDEIIIPLKRWKNLLSDNVGKSLYVKLFTKKEGKWYEHPLIENKIAKENIDPYLVYRYIQASYEILGECKIVQRCLENFEEKDIINNHLAQGTCLNCHTFNEGNPDQMMFHIRFTKTGTLIYKDGDFLKSQTATNQLKMNGGYPYWHPDGKYIAFSLNGVIPTVYTDYKRYMEAFDTIADMAIFDVERNIMISAPQLRTKKYNETHPCWSPSGEWLYYCRAKMPPISKVTEKGDTTLRDQADVLADILYDLVRVRFHQEKKGNKDTVWFDEPELVLSYEQVGKSISLPRISPNGKYLMFAAHNRGTFASWHRDADLFLMDLQTGEWAPCDGLNGRDADSYHSWSRNSRWTAFASKRIDGFYTRLYLGYVDENGKTYKPFILPQKDPKRYSKELYLYNLPELTIKPMQASAREIAKEMEREATQAGYEFTGGIDTNTYDVVSGATQGQWDDKKSFQ